MTEEGRRFTIERIDKYKEEVDKNKLSIVANTFSLGIMATLAVAFGNSDTSNNLDAFLHSILLITTSMGGTFTLKNLILAISRKTGIEIKIEDLEAQLRLDEIEEKGKSI